MEVQTERLLLRPWREEDTQALYRYASDERVGPVAGWAAHTSVAQSKEIIRTILSAEETYAVVLRETNEAIGSVGFKRNMIEESEVFEVGYWIGVPYWGCGLIPEAVRALMKRGFEELGLEIIWCAYHGGNEKSRRVQEKLGFRYTHTEIDKFLPLLNEWRTTHFSKITKEEWAFVK